jgi:hypothetical protein
MQSPAQVRFLGVPARLVPSRVRNAHRVMSGFGESQFRKAQSTLPEERVYAMLSVGGSSVGSSDLINYSPFRRDLNLASDSCVAGKPVSGDEITSVIGLLCGLAVKGWFCVQPILRLRISDFLYGYLRFRLIFFIAGHALLPIMAIYFLYHPPLSYKCYLGILKSQQTPLVVGLRLFSFIVHIGSKGMALAMLEIEARGGKGLNTVTGTTPRLVWSLGQICRHSFRGKEMRRDHGLPEVGVQNSMIGGEESFVPYSEPFSRSNLTSLSFGAPAAFWMPLSYSTES